MTRNEQSKFVADLCGSVMRDLQSKIEAGAVPTEWDGHELRAMLADKFEGEAVRSLGLMRGKRLKTYRNTMIVANL